MTATFTIPVSQPGVLQSQLVVHFTDAAVAHLDNGNIVAVAAFCIADLLDVAGLAELASDEEFDLGDVLSHVVETYGLIMTFDDEGDAWLDVVEHEYEPITDGPFAGMKLVLPVGKTKE